MYKHSYILLILACCYSCVAPKENLLRYADPGIGTAHSRWFFYTPAAVPHGMAKLAPSTNGHYGNPSGWEAVGYDTRHTSIEGFAHFHEWQVGGVVVMPATGQRLLTPGELEDAEKGIKKGYRSSFNHKTEVAQPGYYKVELDDYHITAELTATERVGFHRYTFPAGTDSRIILDIGNKQGESGEVLDAEVHMTDETHFEGFVTTYPAYIRQYDPKGSISMYFYGEISKRPTAVGAFNAGNVRPDVKSSSGKGAGIYLEFPTTSQETVELKVGLSYTSASEAQKNLIAEATGLDFNKARKRAQDTWQREFSKLTVAGGDVKDKTKFYTGLYHALLGRGIINDAGQPNRYNTDAIWGAFWNLTQLWALSYPERYNDYVRSQLDIYRNRGWFADGVSNGHFTSGVGTNFVGLAVAAAYQCGIRDYDTALAYKAIKANEIDDLNRPVGSGKLDVGIFNKLGYVPLLEEDKTDSTGSRFSASHTLEYSYSAFAAAQMAKAMGKTADYNYFIDKSNGWRLLFNNDTKLIQPKTAAGTFIENFDPMQPWRGFQEGNAVQYTFYVPQNPAGLIAAMGKEEFNTRLDRIFTNAQQNSFGGGKTIDAFAGINASYNHGNQPNLHISWLFNYSGKPWLTQKWTRAICNEFYGTESIHGYGYGQDEDQGQLGAWYVMSALGLFDVKGLTDLRPAIQLGSPLFEKATVTLGNGRKLHIITKNNSKENVYVQAANFNGQPLQHAWLYRDELMKGGTLTLEMGSSPNEQWGQEPPPSIQ
ncbi:GH92 family glycosyl hydrolase [Chitinophaga rhizophila]|uniref:GH92 family glycosyl hydrolase n=1 Tax=Chitinophaga rhizophila TaxID=2866212 RepID=A0ABS7GHL5_9BACT|nr:GH92 family glycosyl hydrolase [Chitinophaga rhizophila]MBW8687190.1 GH92 family glycosyl hydrolase [Chitinophaga rhizophila]